MNTELRTIAIKTGANTKKDHVLVYKQGEDFYYKVELTDITKGCNDRISDIQKAVKDWFDGANKTIDDMKASADENLSEAKSEYEKELASIKREFSEFKNQIEEEMASLTASMKTVSTNLINIVKAYQEE